ncbi:MAG TPA: hypothetical protein VKT82_07535 [Ktedonobacterales bacterium]|nr:hypothetical protein [Ktedonobacterales bacterium]
MPTTSPSQQCWRCHRHKKPAWNTCPFCGAHLRDARTPAPPNLTVDLKFLRDLYNYGWYNRHEGMVALYDVVADIQRFFPPHIAPDLPEEYRFTCEPARVQRILRAKIFAECMAQYEAFGMLCLTVANRKSQSIIWSYLNTQPEEVTQFYQRILNSSAPSLQKLLNLPRLSEVIRALTALEQAHPERAAQLAPLVESAKYDYAAHNENLVLIARAYLGNKSANVQIYNKIKHGFAVIEGQDWFTPPLAPDETFVLIKDDGQVARLKMGQSDVDEEMKVVHAIMKFGVEIIALCIMLDEFGMLYQ